jgi:hypothetical protein
MTRSLTFSGLTKAETLVTGGFTAGGSWAIRFPAPKKIKFFAVIEDGCWVCIDGRNQCVLTQEM